MGDPAVFKNTMVFLKRKFIQLSATFERRTKELIREHLGIITNTFDIVRGQNALEESERDPKFREFIRDTVASIWAELDELREVVDN